MPCDPADLRLKAARLLADGHSPWPDTDAALFIAAAEEIERLRAEAVNYAASTIRLGGEVKRLRGELQHLKDHFGIVPASGVPLDGEDSAA